MVLAFAGDSTITRFEFILVVLDFFSCQI